MSASFIAILFRLLGGLGLFLYGMEVMSGGIKRATDGGTKQLSSIWFQNKWLSTLLGIVAAGVVQSATIVAIMVVGIVNAGVISMTQAIRIMIGAGIGVAFIPLLSAKIQIPFIFQMQLVAPLILFVGLLFFFVSKENKKKMFGEIAIGFGILFIGFSFLSNDMSLYKDSFIFQNIMSCILILVLSTVVQRNGKRTAISYIMISLIGVLTWWGSRFMIFNLDHDLLEVEIKDTQAFTLYCMFYIIVSIGMVMLVNQLVRFSGIIIRKTKEITIEEKKEEILLKYLDENTLETPAVAFKNAILEVGDMGEAVGINIKLVFDVLEENNLDKINLVYENERMINNLEKLITGYLIKISELSLTEKQYTRINHMFYVVDDMERIGDHARKIARLAQTKYKEELNFSKDAQKEINKITQIGLECIKNVVLAVKEDNIEYVRNVAKCKEKLDNMQEELREKHIERLTNKKCSIEAGIVFADIISNVGRISDHAYNIAGYVRNEIE